MQSMYDMKLLLLEILENAFSIDNIQATQQMGVNMSNAVKRDGMVIIQNQNVEVYARIMPNMVKALKLCDALEHQVEIKAIPQPTVQSLIGNNEEDPDPINECCSWMFENNINWEDMQDLMKRRYAEYVVPKFKTKKEAAKFLNVGSTYLSRITALLPTNKKFGE